MQITRVVEGRTCSVLYENDALVDLSEVLPAVDKSLLRRTSVTFC